MAKTQYLNHDDNTILWSPDGCGYKMLYKFDQPYWKPVAGRIGLTIPTTTIYMMDGFDNLPMSVDSICSLAASKGIGIHYICGSLNNPLFSWPVYAIVQMRDTTNGPTEKVN